MIIKLFENFKTKKDVINFTEKLAKKLFNNYKPFYANKYEIKDDGVNGVILNFYFNSGVKKLNFSIRINNGEHKIVLVDVKNEHKEYYPNDTYGFNYDYIPVDSIKDLNDYAKYLY